MPVPSAEVQVVLDVHCSVKFVRRWFDGSYYSFRVAEAVGGSSGSVAGIVGGSGSFLLFAAVFFVSSFFCVFSRFLFTGIAVGGGLFWIFACC